MATADHWAPSRRIRSAAAAERDRVERELARLAARERELTHEIDSIGKARASLEHELGVLDRLAGPRTTASRHPQPAPRRLQVVPEAHDATVTMLRGAHVRETAVRVLAASGQAGESVHYRTWFDLLRQRGFLPAGKDPLATFLTQIGRSPVVRRSTEPGVYSLDLAFPERATSRLQQLKDELEHVGRLPTNATVEELARTRERTGELQAEIHSIERALAEAQRSLPAD